MKSCSVYCGAEGLTPYVDHKSYGLGLWGHTIAKGSD
jgi:hypothetical protein